MDTGEYIRNLTWVGSLVPPDLDAKSMSQDELLIFLDRFVPPSRKNWGAPKGRRSSYFYRVLRREFSPRWMKVDAAETVAPGSTRWFRDTFWNLLNAEPMNPDRLTAAWWRIPHALHPRLNLVDNGIPTIAMTNDQLRAQCEEYGEHDSWNAFKCLFLLTRIAEAHQDWERFELIRPYLYISTYGCLSHPVLRFSSRFLSLFVLTWISTRGRCGLEAIPQRLWIRNDLLCSLFRYALPGICETEAFIYGGMRLLNPLSGLATVPNGELEKYQVARKVGKELEEQLLRNLSHRTGKR